MFIFDSVLFNLLLAAVIVVAQWVMHWENRRLSTLLKRVMQANHDLMIMVEDSEQAMAESSELNKRRSALMQTMDDSCTVALDAAAELRDMRDEAKRMSYAAQDALRHLGFSLRVEGAGVTKRVTLVPDDPDGPVLHFRSTLQ